MNTQKTEPKLQPPGAGLPFFQRLVAKHIFLPRYWKKTSWDSAVSFFKSEGEKIAKLIRTIDAANQNKRVLIEPIQGLEDSSRYWSAIMVAEHLVVTGKAMLQIVMELSEGKQPTILVNTAQVKPKGDKNISEVLEAFEGFQREFCERVGNQVRNRQSPLKHPHPWFGGITAHQWVCIAAVHTRTHRKQVEAIIKGL